MRLSEFAEKRIINLYDGEILGSVGESDLLLDGDNGRILEIMVPVGERRRRNKRILAVPWAAVKKVGSQVVVVDVENDFGLYD